jgi:hypothetical protein
MAREELAKPGLDLTYKTFTIYLDRVRKERNLSSSKGRSSDGRPNSSVHSVNSETATPAPPSRHEISPLASPLNSAPGVAETRP